MKIEGSLIKFECTPERCLYNTDDYKIYGCIVDSIKYPDVKLGKYFTATIVGNFQQLTLGLEYEVTGVETTGKHGISYKVKNIRMKKLDGEMQTLRFLEEILTYNQAHALINAYPDIVDRVVHDRLDDIDLSKTKGIKEYTFGVIKRKIIENFYLCEIVEEFNGLFDIKILRKLYDRYASVEKVREELEKNPYKCLCGIGGVSFKTADNVLMAAQNQSLENGSEEQLIVFSEDLKESYQRLLACSLYLLGENESSGNTYLHVQSFKNSLQALVPQTMKHLLSLLTNGDIYFDKDKLIVAKVGTYEAEKYIAERICTANDYSLNWMFDGVAVEDFREIDSFSLTDEQMETLHAAKTDNVVVLVGYAGSGKSSSTKALINMMEAQGLRYALMAPTGRAAKVLSGYTGRYASTIHRGLGYSPASGWGYNSTNPLPFHAVFVDEFSMTDIFLFKRLLEAIDFNTTKLFLIGDDAQIPSVGAGNILHDLLNEKNVKKVTLNKIFRYGEGGLSTVATDIRETKLTLPEVAKPTAFGTDKSFVFLPIEQSRLLANTVALYKKLLDDGCAKEDIGILTCFNKGDYGTESINKAIQKAVNGQETKFLKSGETEFRENDMVINVVNNYQATLCDDSGVETGQFGFVPNGDIGRVAIVDDGNLVVRFPDQMVKYQKSSLSTLKLAYAISLHKSQGGQFRKVILLTPKAHMFMLNSNLMYVGVTRAKEQCYQIGQADTVNRCVKRKEDRTRKTMLGELLRNAMQISNEQNNCNIKGECG